MYLALWARYEQSIAQVLDGDALVKCLWLAGSFISDRIDPNNVDVNIFVNAEALDRARAAKLPVTNPLKALSAREKMLKNHRVSPILVPYRYFRSPFKGGFDPMEAEYMQLRGGFDDFWSRIRQTGQDKQAPTRETGEWRRGYLEVML